MGKGVNSKIRVLGQALDNTSADPMVSYNPVSKKAFSFTGKRDEHLAAFRAHTVGPWNTKAREYSLGGKVEARKSKTHFSFEFPAKQRDNIGRGAPVLVTFNKRTLPSAEDLVAAAKTIERDIDPAHASAALGWAKQQVRREKRTRAGLVIGGAGLLAAGGVGLYKHLQGREKTATAGTEFRQWGLVFLDRGPESTKTDFTKISETTMLSDLIPYFDLECARICGMMKTAESATEKVDRHHIADAKDWAAFEKNMRGKRFRNAVLTHDMSDEKLKAYVKANGDYRDSKDVVGIVPSRTSTKTYKVKRLPGGRLACGCKDWQYKHSHRGTDCDHIRELANGLKEKISAAPSPQVMWDALTRIKPQMLSKGVVWKPEGRALVSEYRSALKGRAHDVPLAQRLENYKFWKRTGEVPALVRNGEGKLTPVTDPSKFGVHRPMKVELSDSPIALTSTGGLEGLQNAVKRGGQTKMDRRYLIPGETSSQAYGLYSYPTEMVPRGTRGYEGGAGVPGRLDLTIPRRKVLQSTRERPEVIIPHQHLRSATVKSLEKVSNPVITNLAKGVVLARTTDKQQAHRRKGDVMEENVKRLRLGVDLVPVNKR